MKKTTTRAWWWMTMLVGLAGCHALRSGGADATSGHSSALLSVVGNGQVDPGEDCDDGNTSGGDGCSSTGTVEAGFLCHQPGTRCSAASACGNGVLDSGEACDDGNSSAGGCSADCDLSLCGNGILDNRAYPNFDQELCDDGNRFDGDGCTRLCQPEPGWACDGQPARCVRVGVALFSTGVDSSNKRLADGVNDSHWLYAGNGGPAATGGRIASDWPRESASARFMKQTTGVDPCVRQDFLLPVTLHADQFRMRIATFNDDDLASIKVNGMVVTSTIVSQPTGQPWQKNILREVPNSAGWRAGLNRVEVCNVNSASQPNSFRYLVADVYDGRCGDGAIASREECDDGNKAAGDGCDPDCGIEAGFSCTGVPSTCARLCGNGIVNPGEECDDGNGRASDGCDSRCRVEKGFACPTSGSPCVSTCGNGLLQAGEECDDGNAFPSDGCSPACRIEKGWQCFGAPSTCRTVCGNGQLDPGEQCDDGNARQGDGCSVACTYELEYACPTAGAACARTCGDGKVDPGEECDDANLATGDGCRTDCHVETGWACSGTAGAVSTCAMTCGNGTVETNEECDDHNTTAGDGCSPGCRREPGWTCPSGMNCTPTCGDGIVTATEQCDDTVTPAADGNGCSATCTIEPGYVCPPPGVVCNPTCGNGAIEAGEACDDNNKTDGDGCSSSCAIESGFHCAGSPSACGTTCGDGIKVGNEICDDGNLVAGDGCAPTCLQENGQACAAGSLQCAGVCNPVTLRCASKNACGNGVVEGGEGCDDGNTTVGDGCTPACRKENGQTCSVNAQCTGVCNPTTSTCAALNTCGNGFLEGSEKCDDGNLLGGDGCAANCLREIGQPCTKQDQCAGVCNPGRGLCDAPNVCNNGVKEGSEICDDGTDSDFDGCTGLCLLSVDQACTLPTQCATNLCDPVTFTCNAGGVCGNSVVEPGEICDDISGECDAQCKRPLGARCNATSECSGGNVCNFGAPPLAGVERGTCAAPSQCGNGVREPGEGCDDGNPVDGDSCSNGCKLGNGVACVTGTQCATSLCSPIKRLCVAPLVCGNGIIEASEGCDDGNTVSGDGCTATCDAEPNGACRSTSDCAGGFVCNPVGRVCQAVGVCGNGVVDPGEPCDDGNPTSGDGCTPTCLLETGLPCVRTGQCVGVCNVAAGICAAKNQCGNGTLEAGEKCDDGNGSSGDGCSGTCVNEDGRPCQVAADCTGTCNPTKHVCAPVGTCNNGVLEGAEVCDDGTDSDFDGCTRLCLRSVAQPCTVAAQCSTNLCDPLAMTCGVAGICGNHLVELGEICDGGPDCDASCKRPLGAPCNGTIECAAGVCNTGTPPLSPATAVGRCARAGVCGNGVAESGEICDDGNANEDDGCTTGCLRSLGGGCSDHGQCVTDLCSSGGVCVLPLVCGNGVVDGIEGCDDGNNVSGDGCTAYCVAEAGGECGSSGDCLAGFVCNPATARCAGAASCGNGFLDGFEGCDDGNNIDGDGCSARCRLESGSLCSSSDACVGVCNPATNMCAPANLCGNGTMENAEACDDGNNADGDGCSVACKREVGAACTIDIQCTQLCNTVSGTCAALNVCGNSRVEAGEGCDDGNTRAGDGCNATCARETGQPCNGEHQCAGVCDPNTGMCTNSGLCGDGKIEGDEICDDGDRDDTNMCANSCRLALGQPCTSQQECDGVCNPVTHLCDLAGVCGNGIIENNETCDDANQDDGDACLSTCTARAPRLAAVGGGGLGCSVAPFGSAARLPQLAMFLLLAALLVRRRPSR